MQLLMFSGNSLRNLDWIYEAREQLRGDFDSAYVQGYAHWTNGDEWIDLPHELSVLEAVSKDFETDYGVFAKSIGTVLATQALERALIKPKFLLLCGLPLGYIDDSYPRMASVLAASQLPITAIHNRHDTVGTAEAAKSYLSSLAERDTFRFIETPGDTHDYEDYDLLREQLKALAG